MSCHVLIIDDESEPSSWQVLENFLLRHPEMRKLVVENFPVQVSHHQEILTSYVLDPKKWMLDYPASSGPYFSPEDLILKGSSRRGLYMRSLRRYSDLRLTARTCILRHKTCLSSLTGCNTVFRSTLPRMSKRAGTIGRWQGTSRNLIPKHKNRLSV